MSRIKVHRAFLQVLKEDSSKALSMLADYCLADNPDPALRSALNAKYSHVPAELVYGDLYACNEFDVMDKVNTLALPTCIIVGEQDKLTPVKYSKHLNEAIKGSSLSIIPNAGHLVSREQPSEFNKTLKNFLEALAVR